MKTIEVVYKAFSNIPDRPTKPVTSFTFICPEYLDSATDLQLCEIVFEITNLQQGEFWRKNIEPFLPKNRTHTSLSIGDQVIINGIIYQCADLGFEELTFDEDSKNESYYFDHADGRFI